MKIEDIYILLDKYWDCNTSIEEEKDLQDFFSSDNIPNELLKYAPYFKIREQLQSATPSTSLDQFIEDKFKKTYTEKKYITIRIFQPALNAAASVAIILGIGLATYIFIQENKKPYFAETYNDPNIALQHATSVIMDLSDALKMGEEVSEQTLEDIEKLGTNIDWTILDSLDSEGTQSENNKTLTEGDL